MLLRLMSFLLLGIITASPIQVAKQSEVTRSTGSFETFEHHYSTPPTAFTWFIAEETVFFCSFNGIASCNNSSSTYSELISVSYFYVDDVTTNLTIRNFSEKFNEKIISLKTHNNYTYEVLVIIKNCPSTLKNGLQIVNRTGVIFDAKAKFKCYSTKQLLDMTNSGLKTSTKCTKFAEWEHQTDFFCAEAYLVGPHVPCTAGSKLEFSCILDNLTYTIEKITYYLNGERWNISKVVTWRENQGNFSCEITIYNHTISSYNHTILNIAYGPTWNKKDFSCYENKSCVFTVYFNPTAKSINLTQTEGGNMFQNYTSEIQNQSNNYTFNKSLSMGSYVLSVTNKVQTTRFKFKVVNSANLSGQSYLSWILGFGIPPAVIFPGILVYVGYKRKGKPKKSKKKNSQNQIAMSSDVANNVVANNGTNMQTTNEKEDRVNPLYAASGSHPDSLEDAYAQVDKHKKSEKEDKINPLYGATGQETLGENSETYASVNKLNKKKKKKADKGSKEKEVRVNPIYASSSTAIPETNEATYAVVDKKSKSKSEKEDRVNPLYGKTGKEIVAKENTETYSTVNKIKKK